eukprot:8771374-Pyramimonas_sp.AAC.1
MANGVDVPRGVFFNIKRERKGEAGFRYQRLIDHDKGLTTNPQYYSVPVLDMYTTSLYCTSALYCTIALFSYAVSTNTHSVMRCRPIRDVGCAALMRGAAHRAGTGGRAGGRPRAGRLPHGGAPGGGLYMCPFESL